MCGRRPLRVEDVEKAEAIMSNENLSVIGNLAEKIPALAEVMWKDRLCSAKKWGGGPRIRPLPPLPP